MRTPALWADPPYLVQYFRNAVACRARLKPLKHKLTQSPAIHNAYVPVLGHCEIPQSYLFSSVNANFGLVWRRRCDYNHGKGYSRRLSKCR